MKIKIEVVHMNNKALIQAISSKMISFHACLLVPHNKALYACLVFVKVLVVCAIEAHAIVL